ncbi:MAG: TonB-dependent receptor [Thermodesulfobacteriota bacterium]
MRVRLICGIMGWGLVLGVLMGNITDLRAQESSETITIAPAGEAEKSAPQPAATPPAESEKSAKKPKEAKSGGETHALDKVVITATKTPRNPDDVPASITVITSKDIERQNIQTADQALAQVPGAYDRRGKGWADTMTSVTLRGFPSQPRTLVLYDGQNLATAYSKGFRWTQIPVEEIDRIEVVRGPFSSLYGGNAMGGVINIITKTPKKLELESKVGYGTYDSWGTYLAAGNRFWDKLSLKVSYTYQDTAGYPSDLVTRTAGTGAAATQVVGWIPSHTTVGKPTYIIGDKGDNSFWNSSVNTKLSWDIAPGHKLDFGVLLNWSKWDYSQYHTYLRNAATGSPVYQGTVGLANTNLRFSGLTEGAFLAGPGREHTALYNFSSEHALTERTTLKLRGGLLNQPLYEYETPGTTAATTFSGGPGTMNANKSRSWTGEVQVVQAIGTKQTLTGGITVQADTSTNKTYDLSNWRNSEFKQRLATQAAGKTITYGFYAQDEIAWHPMFSTVLGARLDWWGTYDGMYQEAANSPETRLSSREELSFNPKVAFLFRPWDWMSWRASAGTTFRPPSIYELYNTWRASSGTIYKSNPFLKPEKAVSWEVGATLKPFPGNVITATFFDNYLSDMIYRVTDTTDPTGKTLISVNAGQARIYGLELEVTQKLFSWLDVFGNMTVLNGRLLKNDYNPIAEGKKLTFVPRQQFNFGLNAKYWIFNGNLTGRYVSKVYSRDDNGDTYNGVPSSYDPFFTLDAKLTATPVKYASVSFSVDNILNREYFTSSLTPGRTFWVEMKLKY